MYCYMFSIIIIYKYLGVFSCMLSPLHTVLICVIDVSICACDCVLIPQIEDQW